ncbi:MAG: cytochrome-c peroxidase [Myxococcales bacterium]|nr:cytochrome-c peroxidase [Myxococcales bacterium]
MTYLRMFALSSLALAGCQDAIDLDPLDEAPVVESSVRPPPILGGTLTLLDDGTAIAADPDRDVVYVVDLDAAEVRHTIALQAGDRPHRVVVGGDERVHVVLRGAGGFATLDVEAGSVTARHKLCPEPRGLAFKAADRSLYLACAGGSLLHLSEAGELLERHELEPDLHDVLLVDGEVKVSLFRSAQVVGLDGAPRITIPDADDAAARVAWRTWPIDGGIAMLHQVASKRPVPVNPDSEDIPEGGSPYGGGGSCGMGIVNTAITTITANGVHTVPLFGSNLTVDAAFAPDGLTMAMAVPGVVRPEDVVVPAERRQTGLGRVEVDVGEPSAAVRPPVRVDSRIEPGCPDMPSEGELADFGQATAVAYTSSGRLVVQSRQPARLIVSDADGREVIELGGESRFDTGHEIFHRATDSGLSCASCHPEGTDDGHVWKFEGFGPRRTQPIDVGLADTAPYHWDGDMQDFDVLMAEVLAHRMGGKRQSPERGESFTRWIFAQERPAVVGDEDAALVAAGERLFADYACGKCHDGPGLGGSRTETIAGVAKQVPTLRRISLHPPFMHDGRAPTLEAAIRDMIATTRERDAPAEDVAAIAAYLRTL